MDATTDKNDTKYYPSIRHHKRPVETVISNFQAGHGFTKFSGAGTQTDDTVNYHKGTQSMMHTTDGLGSTIQSRKTISSTDFTGKYVKAWIMISDITKLSSIRVRLSSDTFTNYYDFQVVANSTQITDSNTWIPITLTFGKATLTGTPNRAAIINIAVLCADNNTASTINVWWGGLSTFPEFANGIVTFRFDDGWQSQYTRGKAVLDTYNYKASFFVIPDFVNTTSYMTLAQMKDLYIDGHDIACHHQTSFGSFSSSALETILKNIKSWLIQNNFNRAVDFIVYPNGTFNETTIAPLIRKYFRAGAIVTTTANETLPPGDPYRIRIMNITASTAPATVTAAITTATTNKEWLILMFHDIVASGATGNTQYNKADLQTIADFCNTNSVSVMSFSDVWSLLG